MRWVTHQTAALGLALVLQLPLISVMASWFGGILPDVIDQRFSKGIVKSSSRASQQRVFGKIHRGFSHWFGWYLLFFVAAEKLPLPLLAEEILWGVGLGGVSHVMLDMLTPKGVPLWPIGGGVRMVIPFCKTGSWREYAFLLLMILVVAIIVTKPYWYLVTP
ncbi:MAG: metal-dependent hydrolase [Desulfovibrionaceae bacterium]|nr:metal-dependent hydrolase [Desulfovibrionaceae bacterium]